MGDHIEHAFPCCGGLAFHVGTSACDAFRAPARPQFVPTAFRFTWRTEKPSREPPPEGYEYVDYIPWRDASAMLHGECFRAARVTYGLTLREVARGWATSDVEVGELERGLRRFVAPGDLHAALQQLWCWANEKNSEVGR